MSYFQNDEVPLYIQSFTCKHHTQKSTVGDFDFFFLLKKIYKLKYFRMTFILNSFKQFQV